MKPHLKILISQGATEPQALTYFKKLGYNPKQTKAIMEQQGISFPKIYVYNDRILSPDRVLELQELSLT